MADPESTLNKRDEIMEKCKHKRKYTLRTLKPPKTDQYEQGEQDLAFKEFKHMVDNSSILSKVQSYLAA